MLRIFTFAALAALVAAPTAARPGLGLKVKRVGDNVLIQNPVIKQLPEFKPLPKHSPPHSGEVKISPLMQPDSVEGWDTLTTHRITRQFRSGDAVIVHFGSGSGEFDTVPMEEQLTTLTDKAWEAVDLAPDWVRLELVSNLAHCPHYMQDTLADLMLEVEDPLWLDEIAFLIANLSPDDIMNPNFRPGFITEQAMMAYKVDPDLDYVVLKEVGEPGVGDYWTTAVYKYTEEGELGEWELPREHYYWWIIGTRLDGEEQIDIDPATGKYEDYPGGVAFKEYYYSPPDTVEDYMRHYIFRDPPPYEKYKGMVEVPYESLQDWGPSQQGYFPDWEIGPLLLTMDSEGRATTIEFKLRPKGILLATTLRVEEAYAEGKSDLLQSMLRYGAGNVVMRPDYKHLVVMEQAPFGLDGVIEGVLDEWEVNYDIVDADYLYDADLTEVYKIIVPSDQPLAVYQAISDNAEKIKEWTGSGWRILEIHGAVSSEENDWSGIVMPGGFTAAGLTEAGDDEVFVEGQPPLAKYVANTETIWDMKKYQGLTGDRPYDPDTFAIDKLGWWASNNVFDSAVDFGDKHNWLMIPERTSYSVRVLYNHYGNCGENEDVFTSVGRTMLVPTANCANGPEDHVWSEFYFKDSWHAFQMGWADAPTDIDHPGMSSGSKWGGGKNNSFIIQTRTDGSAVNRVDYYHATGDLTLNVVDQQGAPVQGAPVLFVTESYYKIDGSYPLTIAFWDITDENGQVKVKPGTNVVEDLSQCHSQEVELRCNSYYVKVLTREGNIPPEDGKVMQVLTFEEAVPDFEKEVTVTLEAVPAERRPAAVVDFDNANPAKVLQVNVDTLQEVGCGYSVYSGKYCNSADKAGLLDMYIIDHSNLAPFLDDEPFEALAEVEGISEGFEFAVNAPYFGDWYFVLVHQNRFQREELTDIRFSLLEGQPPVADEPAVADYSPAIDDVVPMPSEGDGMPAGGDGGVVAEEETKKKSGGGCSTHSTANPAGLALLLLWISSVIGLALRRKNELA